MPIPIYTPGAGLNKQILIIGIGEANEAVKGITDEQVAWETWVNKLADAIEAYIKSGKVITVGSATTQTGSIT